MRRGVDDGDAWRLIKIVFWGILLLLGIRLALALILMIRYRSAPITSFAIALRFRGRQYPRRGPRSH